MSPEANFHQVVPNISRMDYFTVTIMAACIVSGYTPAGAKQIAIAQAKSLCTEIPQEQPKTYTVTATGT